MRVLSCARCYPLVALVTLWRLDREDYGEERFNRIGMVEGQLLVVIPTRRMFAPHTGSHAPPPRGGRTERHGLSRPSATAATSTVGRLSPMAFLVGVSARQTPPPDAPNELAPQVSLRGAVGASRRS